MNKKRREGERGEERGGRREGRGRREEEEREREEGGGGEEEREEESIPDANNTIGVIGIEGVSVGSPAEVGADGVVGLSTEVVDVLGQAGNDALALECPDLDGGVSS